MTTAFLWLYLAGLVHLYALYGFAPGKHPWGLLPLLPLAGLLRPGSLPPLGRAGLLGLSLLGAGAMLLSLCFARPHAWNGPDWLSSVSVCLAGLATVAAAVRGEAEDRGAAIWVWCALWFLVGRFDPFLPVLGASLGAVLVAASVWRAPPESARPGSLRFPHGAAFGIAALLGKPWWDFGLEPGWAHASAAFALGVAVVSTAGLRRWASRVPEGAWFGGLAAGFCLYPSIGGEAWTWVWGLGAGFVSGGLWVRRPQLDPAGRFAAAVVVGLVFSFALHANLWIPGLRSLLWPGS